MSEEEWQRITAPIAGPHEIDGVPRWGCPTEPAGPDSLLIPPVDCVPRSSPDAPMQQIKDCDVRPHCRGHADCSALPFGRCQGELEAKCVYPSAPPSPCSSQSECRALPLGGCMQPVEPNTLFCYPSGRCERQQAVCGYLREWCASDADCTTAPLGSCQKLILHAHCEAQGCLVDGDCSAGRRCACSRPANACVPADCMTDGDCPSGEQCRLETGCFNIALGYHCSTPLDTCRSQADCNGGSCDFEGRWQCSPHPCID